MTVENPALLATLWFPSLNPVGAPTIFALCVCVLGIILTENWKRFHYLLTSVLIVIVPPILFAFIVGSKVAIAAFEQLQLSFPWKSCRNFPDADDFCANYIYLAFGLIISLRVWRSSSVPFCILGTLESVFLASLIITEFVGLERIA